MSFSKLKDIFHSLCKALGIPHTTLIYFYENQAAVYCEDQNVNQDFFFVGSTLYFLNDFQIHQKAFDRTVFERGQFAGENSVCTIITNTKLSTKKCSCFPRRVLLCLLLLLYYTIIQILTIVFTFVNKSGNYSIN